MKQMVDAFTGKFMVLRTLKNYPAELGAFAKVKLEEGFINLITDKRLGFWVLHDSFSTYKDKFSMNFSKPYPNRRIY